MTSDVFKKLNEFAFSMKLGTNGSNFDVLNDLSKANLLDYAAMHIKHKLHRETEITNPMVAIKSKERSVSWIKNGDVDYEFDSTIVPIFHSFYDVKSRILQLSGSKRFVI
jgi:pyruvate formate lyase activating enzyme